MLKNSLSKIIMIELKIKNRITTKKRIFHVTVLEEGCSWHTSAVSSASFLILRRVFRRFAAQTSCTAARRVSPVTRPLRPVTRCSPSRWPRWVCRTTSPCCGTSSATKRRAAVTKRPAAGRQRPRGAAARLLMYDTTRHILTFPEVVEDLCVPIMFKVGLYRWKSE